MIPPIASRFVAGETEAEAIERARELNDRDIGAILNLLGEHYEELAPAEEDTEVYRRLLADIEGVRACVSVKPSQLGLGVDGSVFRENLRRVVEAAAPEGFVWIDMEGHDTVEVTLEAFEEAAERHPGGVGVCVQANLKRTREDVERLASVPGKVRFVKGAYDPPEALAYTRKVRVNEAYRDLLEFAFREFDGGIAVGSHDPEMIEHARSLHEEYDTGFEIQMLMGVREAAQEELAADYDVWQYVPYGSRWLPYFYRRVLERKENAAFALRAVAGSLLGE